LSAATSIGDLIRERGITRLCHFAPLLNVHHIIPSNAILSSARVEEEHPSGYHPTDLLRLDGRRTHVCASVEFPNVWYLDKLERRADLYPDHAVFLIRPEILEMPGVLFSQRNAAGANAVHLSGVEGFRAIYAPVVVGKGRWVREGGHPPWLPTDMQAEVLIPDAVPLVLVSGLVVKSEDVAKRFLVQLRAAKTEFRLPIIVSGEMFDRSLVSRLRIGGRRPLEERYRDDRANG